MLVENYNSAVICVYRNPLFPAASIYKKAVISWKVLLQRASNFHIDISTTFYYCQLFAVTKKR